MPNRYLKESICTSDNLNRLPMETVAFWVFLLTATDDFGRAYAKPEIIKGRCFPLRPEITPEIIEVRLQELQAEKLLILYEIESRRYLQLANWQRHNRLRAKSSKYPGLDTPGVNLLTHDSTRQQVLADVGRDPYERIQHTAIETKNLAKSLNVPVVLLSQTSRAYAPGNKREMEADAAKGSGDIEAAADFMLGLWQSEDRRLLLKILKNRNGPAGNIFEIALDRSCLRFGECKPYERKAGKEPNLPF
jgi:hypothetical protein